jgi:hypothetical protein
MDRCLSSVLFGNTPVVIAIANKHPIFDRSSLTCIGVPVVVYEPSSNSLMSSGESIALANLPSLPTCPCIIVTDEMVDEKVRKSICWASNEAPTVLAGTHDITVPILSHIITILLGQQQLLAFEHSALCRKLVNLQTEIERKHLVLQDVMAAFSSGERVMDTVIAPNGFEVSLAEIRPTTFLIPYEVWGLVQFDLQFGAKDGLGSLLVTLSVTEDDFLLGEWRVDFGAIDSAWHEFSITHCPRRPAYGLSLSISSHTIQGSSPTLKMSDVSVLPDGAGFIDSPSREVTLPAIRLWHGLR